jgi:DNA invertase Pin-like site-specific DNA recombinase
LESNIDIRFADLPEIEGATGRFLLHQMASVAELEAGMISKRTKDALAAAKARGKKLGGVRVRTSNGQRVIIGRQAQRAGAAANHKRAADRAADLAPAIANIRNNGAATLRDIAAGLEAAGIVTPRGQAKWSPTQVKRAVETL